MYSGETGDNLPKNEAPNKSQKPENEPSTSKYDPSVTENEEHDERDNTVHDDNADDTDCDDISDQDSNQAECNTSNSLSDSDVESYKADQFDSTDQENDDPDYVKFCDYRLAILARRDAFDRIAFGELGLTCEYCMGSVFARAIAAARTRNADAASVATTSTNMDSVKETNDATSSDVDKNNERKNEKKDEIPSCSTDENKIDTEVNDDMKNTGNADQDTLLASGGDKLTIQLKK